MPALLVIMIKSDICDCVFVHVGVCVSVSVCVSPEQGRSVYLTQIGYNAAHEIRCDAVKGAGIIRGKNKSSSDKDTGCIFPYTHEDSPPGSVHVADA